MLNSIPENVAAALRGQFYVHGIRWNTNPFYKTVGGKDALLSSNGSVTLIWLMEGRTSMPVHRYSISGVLEWCRTGTTSCVCGGTGTCTSESVVHGGVVEGVCIDRRELEYALTPFEQDGFSTVGFVPDDRFLFCVGDTWFVLLNRRSVFLDNPDLQYLEKELES